jgi:hypothetical protein
MFAVGIPDYRNCRYKLALISLHSNYSRSHSLQTRMGRLFIIITPAAFILRRLLLTSGTPSSLALSTLLTLRRSLFTKTIPRGSLCLPLLIPLLWFLLPRRYTQHQPKVPKPFQGRPQGRDVPL